VSSALYLEGGAAGADSKELQICCRHGFRRLLEKSGFKGRMPRLHACGPRSATFHDFTVALSDKAAGDYVAMWIDSEDPLADLEAAWEHLSRRDRPDNWPKPAGTADNQVLFMTTCMETLIVADRAALAKHYGDKLQVSALPPVFNLESRPRDEIQNALSHATRNCTNVYAKGKRSFEILPQLTPDTLQQHLPSFRRSRRILDEKL
jgi:Domain of unknown function (DUF4276)